MMLGRVGQLGDLERGSPILFGSLSNIVCNYNNNALGAHAWKEKKKVAKMVAFSNFVFRCHFRGVFCKTYII